jgi:signal transduction histidine kinase
VDTLSDKHPEVRFVPVTASLSRSHYWLEVLRDLPVFGDGWVPINPGPVLLYDVLNEILVDTRNAWPEVAFITKKFPGDLKVIADTPHLRSMLRNVIYNAASFVPDDGLVTIKIDSSRERYISLFVEDDGPGVSPDIAESIFDPFRPSERRPSGHKGMGVGLAVARIIGRSFGGDVICRSNAAQEGGCFEIILPKVLEEPWSIV